MKKLAIVIAVGGLIGTPAFAQAPPPTPVYNWTGWYVGGNLGTSFGRTKTDFNGTPLFGDTTVQVTPGFGVSDTQVPSDFIGGGQIGYNWQYSP